MNNPAPGKLWMYFLEAILITIPASIVLLAGYRRAVARSMRLASASSPRAASGGREIPVGSSKPRPWQVNDDARLGPDRAARRRLAYVYAAGGLVAAGIMAFLFAWSMQFDLTARGAFASWYGFAWPVVPVTVAILALPHTRSLWYLLFYALGGGILVGTWAWVATLFELSINSPLQNVRFFFEFLIRQAWLPYLLILITGNRRLRPVSPVTLAGLLVFSFGTLLARDLYIAAVQADPGNSWLLFRGSNSYSLWFFLAALPIGGVCWWGIQRLAVWYEQKRFSDVQLLVDSWWLIVAFQFSTELASNFGWAGLTGLLAFVGYRGTVSLGLRQANLSAGDRGPSLLLLRVFGYQRRTEALFDAVAERWRFTGPVMMIAGADLAMRTLNPGDVITYVSGRLRSRFIAGADQVHEKAQQIDTVRDPDGRFRTTKFFCHEDTWRVTLSELLRRSDLVLMDLRGFSEGHQGCLFELEQLAVQRLISRTLFIADSETDVSLLEETIRQRQQAAVGQDDAAPQIRQVRKPSSHEFAALLAQLERLAGVGISTV